MKTGKVIAIVLVLEAAVAAFALYADGFTVDGWRTVTRYSGRLSLAVFSIIFLFRHKPGRADEVLLGKPFHFFAFAHAIHLIQLLILLDIAGSALSPLRLLAGIIAYTFTFAMPFAVDRYARGELNPRKYRAMEMVFLYYIWLVFFLTYLPRVQGKIVSPGVNYWEYVALLGWMSLMLGMKITSTLMRKSPYSD